MSLSPCCCWSANEYYVINHKMYGQKEDMNIIRKHLYSQFCICISKYKTIKIKKNGIANKCMLDITHFLVVFPTKRELRKLVVKICKRTLVNLEYITIYLYGKFHKTITKDKKPKYKNKVKAQYRVEEID